MEVAPTEEKIKKAALKEFALYGFEGARVDRIAQKAKINKAMIYYHFKNKEALYEAVLSDIYNKIYSRITGGISQDRGPVEQLDAIISEFIDIIKNIDQDFVKMMLRELSSGGKYFKKLMLPGIIINMFKIIQEIFAKGTKEGLFRDMIPQYTFLQTVGSIVFFNAIRITLQDTDFGNFLFPEDAFEKFRTNLLGILKNGILTH
jgi:TetR/AcrR family transcriptional regulator